MIYLLDTNAISAVMRADSRMATWLSSIGVDDRVVICTITRGEILFGLERLAPGRRRIGSHGKMANSFPAFPSSSDTESRIVARFGIVGTFVGTPSKIRPLQSDE